MQIEFLINAGIFFVFIVGLLHTIKAILRFTKRMFSKIVYKNKRSFYKYVKKPKGFKNYQNDTWYSDGTYWNSKEMKLEKPDYKNE